jgi:hypothetical protein
MKGSDSLWYLKRHQKRTAHHVAVLVRSLERLALLARARARSK